MIGQAERNGERNEASATVELKNCHAVNAAAQRRNETRSSFNASEFKALG